MPTFCRTVCKLFNFPCISTTWHGDDGLDVVLYNLWCRNSTCPYSFGSFEVSPTCVAVNDIISMYLIFTMLISAYLDLLAMNHPSEEVVSVTSLLIFFLGGMKEVIEHSRLVLISLARYG